MIYLRETHIYSSALVNQYANNYCTNCKMLTSGYLKLYPFLWQSALHSLCEIPTLLLSLIAYMC